MYLVTGATGNVGSELVRVLSGDGHPVRALTRSEGRGDFPAGVEVVVGDLDSPETLDLKGISGVFLLSGYESMVRLLARMREVEVEHIVLLSTGAVVDGDMNNVVVRYNVESEEAVRESGIPWTILRPSGFMSNALRWLPQLREGDVIREPFADVPIAAIDPSDIAAVAKETLTGAGHEGRIYRISGPEAILPEERVRILSEVIGRDLRLEKQSDSEARVEMEKTMPVEYVDAFFNFFSDGAYDDSKVYPTVQEVLGREPRAFENWARVHAREFE